MEVVEEKNAAPPKNRENGCVAKQVCACLITASLHAVFGFNFSYASIIVPQLLDERNASTIETTSSRTSWIVSVAVLGLLLSGLLCGFVIDRFGRLNTMKLSSIPSVLGWSLIALANTADVIILGRFVTGFALSFMLNSGYVYIAEVSQPNIRGVMSLLSSQHVALGVLLMYVQGRYLHWRWIAWVIVTYTAIVTALLFLLPESPSWLVSKNRTKQAQKSLNWFYGVKNQDGNDSLRELIDDNANRTQKQRKLSWSAFAQPSVYKPFFILAGLFTFQQFTGVFIIMANSVVFFREIGVTYDAYLMTIIVGLIHLIMTVVSLWLTKIFNRRTLLCASALGMSATLGLSALATKWMRQNRSDITWLPAVLIFAYILISSCGVFSLPFVMSAELFPLEVRGVMQSLTLCVSHMVSFTSLHTYGFSLKILGGVVSLQCFYALISLGFAVYTYAFVPETHKKKLNEIQAYFR